MAYNGPGSCIQSANTCEDESVTSKRDECHTDEDSSSCCSNNVSGSLSFPSKMDDQEPDEWEHSANPRQCVVIEKRSSHVDIMKEIFAKLLLGEDLTGGSKGHSSALALSNSITKLAASVFGELRKLEPLPDEKKNRWRREMEWLLSPTNYMVELIMRPKARVDVHMNLPALLKLDSMLIMGRIGLSFHIKGKGVRWVQSHLRCTLEMLDVMMNTEFWYEEVSQAERKGESVKEGRRWWPLMPHVPVGGLSGEERKKILNQAKIVHQIFMATKSINETILLEMPIPKIIGEVLPKVTCYQHLPSLMYSLRVLSQMSSNKKIGKKGIITSMANG
ncbi:putative PRONE domain, Rop guanine nucleotide exchange factor [Helianthus debilis subsp. tardiflorus]